MGQRTDVVVEVAAAALASATRLPSRCAPHGLPAVDRIGFGIASPRPRTRPTDGAAGVLDMIAAVAEVKATIRVTRVSGWPVCRRCRGRRRGFRILTYLSFWGGLAAFLTGLLVGLVMAEPAAGLLVPTVGGVVLMLVSPIPLTYGQPARIAHAQTTPDGAAVRITDPDPEFARELRALVPDAG